MASSPFTYTFTPQPLPLHETLSEVPRIAVVSPDGKWSAENRSGFIEIENTATGETIQLSSVNYGNGQPLTFSSDAKHLYVIYPGLYYGDDVVDTGYGLAEIELNGASVVDFRIVFEPNYFPPTLEDAGGNCLIFDYLNKLRLLDTSTGVVSDLDVAIQGAAANGSISEVSLVGDGTFALFVSTAGNLVSGDTNGVADVFLKNLETGEITLLSNPGPGLQANGAASDVSLSADGTKLLFTSTATNLVSAETFGFKNVYVKDLATGTITLVSATASGVAGNGDSEAAAFSPDGRSVAFKSTAANLAANDLNGIQDIFLKSLDGGAIVPLTFDPRSTDGFGLPNLADPRFSPDGGTVAFGEYSYALDAAGRLVLGVRARTPGADQDSLSVSKGDGSAPIVYDRLFDPNSPYRYDPFADRSATIAIDYDRDGDFLTTLTGLKDGAAVGSESFTVKVRAHAGSRTFLGDAGGEVVLLSSSDDRADGAAGDDRLYGYAGRDSLSGGAGNDTLEGGFGDDSLDGGADDDSLDGGGGNDTLVGGQGGDILRGGFGTDTLDGGAGNDTLDGGRGNDILRGGTGDDGYIPDSAGDTIVEAAGAGRDTVFAPFSFTLGANVEDLVLVGPLALNGTGNGLANTIAGNDRSNILIGLDGDDVLDGGAGADRLVGGAGNDRYLVDVAEDRIEEMENGGTDTVVARFNLTLGANLENLTLSDEPSPRFGVAYSGEGNGLDNVILGNRSGNSLFGLYGADRLFGNGGNDRLLGGNGADTLDGGEGNDFLDGGLGADIMTGGAGDDEYLISEGGDRVIEAADGGIDRVVTGIDYALADAPNVENLSASLYTGTRPYKLSGNALNNIIRGSRGDDIVDGGAGADVMYGGGGRDTFFVDNGGDVVQGDAEAIVSSVSYAVSANFSVGTLKFADKRAAGYLELTGSSYGQTLIGNGGASRLFGRGGDDTYLVDGSDDLVFEAGAEGNDTVVASGSYTLGVGQEVETLRLADAAGTAALALTGNGFANALIGNAGANVLDGAGGADSLTGLSGDDTYLVDDAGDRVIEAAGQGTDTVRASVGYVLAAGQSIEILELVAGTAALDLTGNELANTLRDNAGDNRLDGGAGADTLISLGGRDVLIGGQGSDTAVIDRSGATAALRFVMESVAGITTLVGDGTTTTSIGNIVLTGGSGGDTFTTLDGIDTLDGGAGADVLNGGTGADRLIGGAGNDTFLVDNAGDRVIEAARGGTDTVLSSTSYTLQAGQEIEALQLLAATGRANLNLTGNGYGQTLVGNNGANVLNGGGGNDTLVGRGGDDTYIVDNLQDSVLEAAGGGTDTVLSSTSYVLTAGQEIEGLQLLSATGAARLDLTGNAFGQTLVSNNGANVLDGRGGADLMLGRGGADTFVFSTALGSGNLDRIADFAAEDTVRLSKSVFAALATGPLAESAFKNLGQGAADADDRIIYNQKNGDLWYDVDGSGSVAGVKFAVLDNRATVTHADFLVV